MASRVPVTPAVLRWALKRSRCSIEDFADRFPRLISWEKGETSPTLRQLEDFANATHVPLGYLFLSDPPEEHMPIADFRRMSKGLSSDFSPELLDTIYGHQERQDWYRDHLLSLGETSLGFIGSVKPSASTVSTAASIAKTIGFSIAERQNLKSWEEALRFFIDQTSEAGVLVMVNGVVGSNTRRKLDPQEFRGFALSDSIAPLIFINGADTKAAQLFTLAHELAHVCLGETALSDTDASNVVHTRNTEVWCDKVAAELLVPMSSMKKEYQKHVSLPEETERLARFFKVSKLVILRRLYDAKELTANEFHSEYKKTLAMVKEKTSSSGGGDFHRSFEKRVNSRFAHAVIVSALEGKTLYRDCFHMLGIRKQDTFRRIAEKLGIALNALSS